MTNKTLMTDYYQLSMYKAYMESGQGRRNACFEYFFRKYPDGWDYLISAGLEQVVDYIQNFDLEAIHKYLKLPKNFQRVSKRIDMLAVPEGTRVRPGEPIIQIIGNLAFVQLLLMAASGITIHVRKVGHFLKVIKYFGRKSLKQIRQETLKIFGP